MAYDAHETIRSDRKLACWKRRTCMERCEISILSITILIILALAAFLILVLHNSRNQHDELSYLNQPPSAYCFTPGCVHASSNVLKYMNSSADPCDDFYEFACGGFLKTQDIPDDKTQLNSFTMTGSAVQQQLKLILEEPTAENESSIFVLLRKLYKACMNVTAIELNSLPILKEILKDLGGWPVVESKSWEEEQFSWRKSVAKFRKYGFNINIFLRFNIATDPKNSSRTILQLDQPDQELSRTSLLRGLKDIGVKAYYDYMVNLAVLFGADRRFAEYEMHNALDLKIKLANISIPQEERRNESALYNSMTIEQLQNNYPNISWLELINDIIALPDKSFTPKDTVIVAVPEYISKFEQLLHKTSKRAQANLAIFQSIRYVEALLPDSIRNLEQQLNSVLFGSVQRTVRWDECVSVASNAFGLAMGALYVRIYFNEESRQTAIEMVSGIRNEFIKILEQVDWMDEETRERAIDKASSMTTHIAYPDELLDDKKVADYYSELDVHTDNYLLFMSNVSVFRFNKHIRELWKSVNKTAWTSRAAPISVNAYYSLGENSIQFPAAILQGMFFDKDRLQSMNYGAIGTIIGHEITHGFDDEGKQYDKHGNLHNWWAESTDKAFMKKAQCIIDQYSGYIVPEVELPINGINTQGENIADNGGIKEAYLAYSTWVDRNGEELRLPGLKFSAKQLFWIATADIWCAKDRKESLAQDVSTDNHAPARFRILGSISNLEYFSKDFNCPLGSKMNPRHKCNVW